MIRIRALVAFSIAFVGLGGCAFSTVQQAGYVDRPDPYEVVQLHFEASRDTPVISTELRHGVRDTFLNARIARRIVSNGGEDAEADAYFALRVESHELFFDLLPWPSFTARSETRYRVRIVDRATGRTRVDADRSLVRHGPFAFSSLDASAVTADLARLLDATAGEVDDLGMRASRRVDRGAIGR